MNTYQMSHLQRSLTQPIVANQLEMSLQNQTWLEDGILGLCGEQQATNFPLGSIEYCQDKHIQLQAWGSLCPGLFSGRNLDGQSETTQKKS